MSRTIHGRSTKALKHLHKAPAALAVYWCYVARMNDDNVAWPSARGLEHDTGWNQETCLNGRALLIELGALIAVKDYVRPEWRELEAGAKARLLNLDKSQYYRPVGSITVKGKKLPLLYTGGDEPNDIDEPAPDARSGRASTPPMIDKADARRNRAEFDSPSYLDSILNFNSSSSSSSDDDVDGFIQWGIDKKLKASKKVPAQNLSATLRSHYERLGKDGFIIVIERCKKRNGRSWDYYLNALRDEQVQPTPEKSKSSEPLTGDYYISGELAAFINH